MGVPALGGYHAPVDFGAFLDDIRSSPDYAGQICYVREQPAREARFAEPRMPLPPQVRAMLAARGIERLYTHQAQALDAAARGENLLLVTGTASGKSLCYTVPIIQSLLADPAGRFLLLFPTKALCQDQYKSFASALGAAGLSDILAGVYDGDTPDALRRKLRDDAAVIFTNPDMLHAAIMPAHGRWAGFLGRLRLLVLDELHTYSGLFGSNMANLLRRFFRVCEHYAGNKDEGRRMQDEKKASAVHPSSFLLHPYSTQLIACSATIGNPRELAERLTGQPFTVIDDDGSPRGRRTYVFWNPPQVRGTPVRSRRSANVEAHELMALLIQHGAATITFSKAKMTAEMIHRYVTEKLRQVAPQLASKVTPYRGGYLPQERRQIEQRLFSGELMGVSTTNALELGIDVGGLDASIIVGYPGTLASFLQQTGRAGRRGRDRDSLAILVGLDTSVNQYVMQHPQYLFGRPVEQAALDPDNPFVVTGHLRCATHELPLPDAEITAFGPHAPLVLRILQENRKVKHLDGRWFHAAAETPQHEFSLRSGSDANVIIQDGDTGAALGEVDKFDAPPLLHPEAIYMHRGDTYRVLTLDLERNLATVKREEVDYYTQPLGGTDVHHIDHAFVEKPLGAGKAYWGEVTSHFTNWAYEKIRFYTLDAISVHGVALPHFSLETMAFWIVPPEELMEKLRRRGLDAFAGLRGIGYATRMLLPLFITCDTLDFSHTVGAINAPWNAIFIYERYPHGLGFTEKAYHRLHEIMPAVLEAIRRCPCQDGCPCCVGKPLRGYTVWNVERGEGSIPSKAAALAILERMKIEDRGLRIEDGGLGIPNLKSQVPDPQSPDPGEITRLEQALRRRLERGREPLVAHPINLAVPTEYPKLESPAALDQPDVARRAERRQNFERDLRRRLAGKLAKKPTAPVAEVAGPAPLPASPRPTPGAVPPVAAPPPPIQAGDSLAARARRKRKGSG